MDLQGKLVIPARYSEALDFSEGLAAVKTEDGKWLFIDKSGTKIVTPETKLTNVMRFTEGFAAAQVREESKDPEERGSGISGSVTSPPAEHIAEQTPGNKWGFIDRSGKFTVQPKYDSVGEFHEGLAPVFLNQKWGYINPQKMAIDATFDNARIFSNGLAAVRKNGKFGYIDKKGAVKIPFQFDRAYDFLDGVAVIIDGRKSFAIDVKGKIVAENFDKSQSSKDGIFVSHWSNSGPKFDPKTREFQVSPVGGHIVYMNRTYGSKAPFAYIDKSGRIKVELKLPAIPKKALVLMGDFDSGRALVSIVSDDATTYYVCDKTGKLSEVSKVNAYQIFSFSDGLARVIAEPRDETE